MRYFLPVIIALIGVTTGVVGEVRAEPDGGSHDTTFRIHSDLGIQTYSGGTGAIGQLTVRLRFHATYYADIVGKSGAIFGDSDPDDQFYLALAVGPGLTTGEAPESWEFRLSPRFTHVHHASTASWRATPISNLLGDSDGGVEHRTGIELALGVTGPRFGRVMNRRIVWTVDILGNALPSSDVMRLGIGAVFGLSLSRP